MNQVQKLFVKARIDVYKYFERAWWARKLNLRFHFSRVLQAIFDSWFLSTIPSTTASNGQHLVMKEATQAVTFLVDSILGTCVDSHPFPFQNTIPLPGEIVNRNCSQEEFKKLLADSVSESKQLFESKWEAREKRYIYRFRTVVQSILSAWKDHFLICNIPSSQADISFDAYKLVQIALASMPAECQPSTPLTPLVMQWGDESDGVSEADDEDDLEENNIPSNEAEDLMEKVMHPSFQFKVSQKKKRKITLQNV